MGDKGSTWQPCEAKAPAKASRRGCSFKSAGAARVRWVKLCRVVLSEAKPTIVRRCSRQVSLSLNPLYR